jgi:hypothetical protein
MDGGPRCTCNDTLESMAVTKIPNFRGGYRYELKCPTCRKASTFSTVGVAIRGIVFLALAALIFFIKYKLEHGGLS